MYLLVTDFPFPISQKKVKKSCERTSRVWGLDKDIQPELNTKILGVAIPQNSKL